MGVATNSSPPGAQALSTEFRYPSVDPGIPDLDVDALLAAHQELIDRIKLCFGMDRASFDQTILPLLRRYAAYVHLLPCTADNYFNEPGGLLRIGLETAFFALQGTDAHIFSGRATITERRNLEPRWRLATFVGGLCCELHRPLSHVIVTDEAGNEWAPYLRPLTGWLRHHQIKRYFLKWRPNAVESRSLGLFALPHVVSAETLQDLATGNTQIVPHLLAAVAGTPIYRDHNVLESLVRRALALVIDRFLLASAERYGKPQLGSHLERYLVDALRRLAASNPGWTPNAEKSRVWHGPDGMFMVWPGSADDIRKLLEADQLPGIPKAPETILEVLLTAGVLTAQEDGKATWLIHPPGNKPALEAVKLSAPAMLFTESDKLPEAFTNPLLTPPTADAAAVAPAVSTKPALLTTPSADDSAKGSSRKRRRASPPSISQVPEAPSPQHPQQLALLDPPPAAPADEAPTPTPITPRPDEPQQARLLAPLRLPVTVRDALAAIVATLSEPEAEWAAKPTDDGLFVPLAALTARKVAPPAATRSLSEVGMLAEPSPISRHFQGQEVVGVLIDKRHVIGLPSQQKEAV
ncbi:conjugal transfer pilus assembly protein TraI [Paucibacter oligotrophus]|uniref:Conjugal transfer pilus assembly protein TraI n=1 Tax=Roseateles oligotrophus TaxID=1769250 RepID=A0A840L978_9BURK|nr:MobH family relaxase [Roseateles oligotrophus]MBB4845134.1 conjugal transfer pilus assembly protein TraI [Roseateles oligotrophus]